MFLFSCCTQFDNNEAYELRAKNQTQKEFQVIKNINNSVNLIPFDTQVLKVKKSSYHDLVKQYANTTNMWEDM